MDGARIDADDAVCRDVGRLVVRYLARRDLHQRHEAVRRALERDGHHQSAGRAPGRAAIGVPRCSVRRDAGMLGRRPVRPPVLVELVAFLQSQLPKESVDESGEVDDDEWTVEAEAGGGGAIANPTYAGVSVNHSNDNASDNNADNDSEQYLTVSTDTRGVGAAMMDLKWGDDDRDDDSGGEIDLDEVMEVRATHETAL